MQLLLKHTSIKKSELNIIVDIPKPGKSFSWSRYGNNDLFQFRKIYEEGFTNKMKAECILSPNSYHSKKLCSFINNKLFTPVVPLLKNISFSFERSSSTLIVGPGGCGKSSVLCGLLGEMIVLNSPLDNKEKGFNNNEEEAIPLIKGSTAYLPQV
jgi:ABC-type multidrug transport system ATPase subunit